MTKSDQDVRIASEFNEMVSKKGFTRIKARKALMKKYHILSHQTIYNILKRTENNENKNK